VIPLFVDEVGQVVVVNPLLEYDADSLYDQILLVTSILSFFATESTWDRGIRLPPL